MELYIFRTDLKTKKRVKALKPIFNNRKIISSWSIDREDIDNVLKVTSTGKLNEDQIIQLVQACGYQCELLAE